MDELLKSYCKQAIDIISEELVLPELSRISFEYVNNSGNNIATTYEWAEITSFFNHLQCALYYLPDSSCSEEKN